MPARWPKWSGTSARWTESVPSVAGRHTSALPPPWRRPPPRQPPALVRAGGFCAAATTLISPVFPTAPGRWQRMRRPAPGTPSLDVALFNPSMYGCQSRMAMVERVRRFVSSCRTTMWPLGNQNDMFETWHVRGSRSCIPGQGPAAGNRNHWHCRHAASSRPAAVQFRRTSPARKHRASTASHT